MNTTIDPTSPLPAETAPSQTMAQGPAFARMVGFAGLFALILGAVVVITNMALTPRWITTGWGYLFSAVGIVLLMYHAVSDGEPEVRRMYGLFSALWLVLGIIASVAPGPLFSPAAAGASKTIGFNLLPWGVGFGFLSLIFAIPFARQETDKTYRSYVELGMLAVGTLLSVGSLLAGLINKEFLVGPGIALALLGLGFLIAYMSQVDVSDGIGYQVAFGLGTVGAAVALFAIAKSSVPTLLHDGPNVLRKPNGSLDSWRVAARILMVLLFAGISFGGWSWRSAPLWLRSTIMAIGAAGIILLAVASVRATSVSQEPFLVPYGIILMGLGVIYLAVALCICSDYQILTLIRRELSAYFYSPLGYFVLGVTTMMQWISYLIFVSSIMRAGQAQVPIPEPIVSNYFFAIFPVFALMIQVPAITMRLLADERRSGSLEVMLTSPVNELPVVLSKFFATWILFMISWLPAGLFLLALRIELGQPFDYRPLLSFYIAFAAQGIAFVAIGLFFSSITKSQDVAQMLTTVAMMLFLLCYFLRDSNQIGLPQYVQVFVGRFSFVHMWGESLEGRLPLRDTILFASLGCFFLFLSVKVLEFRKWN